MTAVQNDKLWFSVVSVLILLLSSLPTWAGYRAETSELHFRGIYYDSQDYAAHIAMMESGRHGQWAYQFRFTTEVFQPAYVRLFYIFLGHFSAWLGLASETTYHLARWLLGFLALYSLYKLTQQIFTNLFWARVSFLLAAVGSGLGWLQLIFNIHSGMLTPIDFWLIDSYVFFSISVFPHFAFVTAAMCLALLFWLDYLGSLRSKNIVWIGLISILVQLTNPIALATVDGSFLGAMLFSWWKKRKYERKHIGALGIIAIAQLPLLLYNATMMYHDPLWIQYTSQHQTLSPPPGYYFWGFALFWPFTVLGMITAIREKASSSGAAIFWVFAGFLLAYGPLYTQQRFLQNITIPLAILVTNGLIALFESKAITNGFLKKWSRSVVILFVFLVSISSIQLSLGRALYLQTHPKDFYYPAIIDNAVAWLRENGQYDDFVLALENTSQILAQKAGVRVYVGHEMETLDFGKKKLSTEAFYTGEYPELAKSPIKWVVFGPLEKKLAPNFQPPSTLKLVYKTQDLQIYEVK